MESRTADYSHLRSDRDPGAVALFDPELSRNDSV